MAGKEVVLKVEHLTKRYRLGVLGATTFKRYLQSQVAKFMGKEDPNTKIGHKHIENDIITAVNDVSFSLKKGERVALIGNNGAGKSTLLKLICRISKADEGYIGYNGRITSMLEVGTGFNGELTGRENIYLNGTILGMRKEQIDTKFDDIVEFSEIGEFIDTPVKRYSSGMYVRLAFAVAAFLSSNIVVMDEVLAVGDVNFQRKCIDKMLELAQSEDRTVIYVSHNMATVKELCTRGIVLDKGRLIFDGDVEKAINIYSKNVINSTTDYKLTEIKRSDLYFNSPVYFVDAYYPNNSNLISDGKYHVRLKWKYRRKVKNLNVRIQIKDARGVTVGSKNFHDLDIKEGKDAQQKDFKIDLSQLQNGIYQTTYTLFSKNKINNSESLDVIEGINFEINNANNNKHINWYSDLWGDIEFR